MMLDLVGRAAVSRARAALDVLSSGDRDFARYAWALMGARGELSAALRAAERAGFTDAATILRAAVDAGTTTVVDWARPLVAHQAAVVAFAESLRSASAFDAMLPNMRQVPLRTSTAVIVAASDGALTGEGLLIAADQLGIDTAGPLLEKKATALVAVTKELLSHADLAIPLIDSELRAAVARATDANFVTGLLDSISTASSSPSSGPSATHALIDFGQMLSALHLDATSEVFLVADVETVKQLASLGFRDMTPTGGTIQGCPVLPTDALVRSTSGGSILAVDARQISAASDTIVLKHSSQANIVLDDAPGAQLVNLWQRNLEGIMATRYFGFQVLRETAVAMVSDVDYVNEVPS